MEKEQEFKIKKYVAIAILLILTLFVAVKNVTAQTIIKTKHVQVQETYVYRDLGTFKVQYPDGSSIGVHAYITKGANKSGYYDQYSNVFTLIAESTSFYKQANVPTWLYGTRIFMNGEQISLNQYPQGLTAYVKTTPTVVYYWYTSSENIGKYYFSWESSAYDIQPH